MECALGRSGDGGSGLKKEEKRSEYSIGDCEGRHKQETVIEEPPVVNPERSMVEAGPSESTAKKEEDVDGQLETTKAQMGEVREENQRLKMRLHKIMMEYRALEKQFHDMVVKQETKKNINADQEEIIEEAELVSLSLGRVPSSINNNPKNEEKVKVVVSKVPLKDEEYYFKEDQLALGLECKFETSKSGSTTDQGLPNNNPISPVNSTSHDEVPKEEEAGESTNKALNKTMRDNSEDEVAAHDQQTPAKKARVCVRARCDTPTMNDGCQWRKYGQKIAKGNPCPRAYYRCTVAPSCPVRKQVQRCVEDMSILITTYEGTHNHTLPLSAHAMASTTSAAASMLLSGSSTSHSASMPSTLTATSNNINLHGLNFYLSDGSKPKQLYLSNPPLSSSPSHPTITLDLTSNPTASSSTSPFVRFTPNYNNQPRYPSSMSLNFSSGPSESNNNTLMSWNNKGFLNYGTRNGTVNFGSRPTIENLYQSYMQKSNNIINPTPPQGALPDTSISAATKAITADPTFQSALAVALSSFIGSSTTTTTTKGNHHQGTVVGEHLGQKMKFAEMFIPPSSTLPSSTSNKVNGCASSFFNKTPANAQTTGSFMSLSPPLPFSTSKSPSASPDDNNNDGDTD